MRKIIYLISCVLLIMALFVPSFAVDENSEEITVDGSSPRLMVIDYEVEGQAVSPGKNVKVKATIKNQSLTKSVKNIKLSINDDSGDIKPVGMGTQYVSIIYAGGIYVWEIEMTAGTLAQIGEHQLILNMEYEDAYYSSYSSSDVLRIEVEQSVNLDFDGAKLPLQVVQSDTVSLEINLMNTGKTDLTNCKFDIDISGLDCGGTIFIGEILAGSNACGNANLRVSNEYLGETSGKVIISYDDAYGRTHTKEANMSTEITEKVIVEPSTEVNEKKLKEKYPLWWAFLLGGISVGGGVGCAIPIGIYTSKIRKEDEKRL